MPMLPDVVWKNNQFSSFNYILNPRSPQVQSTQNTSHGSRILEKHYQNIFQAFFNENTIFPRNLMKNQNIIVLIPINLLCDDKTDACRVTVVRKINLINSIIC